MPYTATSFYRQCFFIAIKDDVDVTEQIHQTWLLNVATAKKYPYVMAVKDSIVLEVYQAIECQSTLAKHFPAFASTKNRAKCYGFMGKLASDELRGRYVGKTVPDKYHKSEQFIQSSGTYWGNG